MRRRTREALRKKARKHGLFIAAVLLLVIAIAVGLMLAPSNEGESGSWKLPQVHSE
jgi:hypothetical protein